MSKLSEIILNAEQNESNKKNAFFQIHEQAKKKLQIKVIKF